MRVVRVYAHGQSFYAALEDETLRCLDKRLGLNDPIPLDQALVLPPVTPSKVICVAVNYALHAEEMGKQTNAEPVIFLKPPTAVIGTGAPIILPHGVGRVDYEGELAIVMGQKAKNLSVEESAQAIFGYCCANDVSARELQKKDGQYCRAKGFDSFCPIGPWIETNPGDINNLTLETRVNGELRQQGSTAQMIVGPLGLVSFVSGVMTLLPGDVILTGTPAGVGPIVEGDVVEIYIEGVGVLSNPVAKQGGATGDDILQ